MNAQTNLIRLEDNLINCIKDCLSTTTPYRNLAKNLSNPDIKKVIKQLNLESKNPDLVIKKNNFEIIVESIISKLEFDKFRIEKTHFPQICPSCKINFPTSFELTNLNINLDDLLGSQFNLDEFLSPVKTVEKCFNCNNSINSEYNFTNLPEILIIILGAKSKNKFIEYKYSHIFQYINNKKNIIKNEFTLKALIGQVDSLNFKSFLFSNENNFNLAFQNNKDVFTNPTILFYEGAQKAFNANKEYLENDIEEEEEEREDKGNKIVIYFAFKKANRKIFLDIDKDKTLEKAIFELKEKYGWLKGINNLKFRLNNKLLDQKKTLWENGVRDNSEIEIEM